MVCLHAIGTFLHILWRGGAILEEEDCERAVFYGNLFLAVMQLLAAGSERNHEYIYPIRPTAHYSAHIVIDMQATRINPLAYATMPDEDFLGKLAHVGRQCHGSTMLLRIIQRRKLYLGIRWRRRRRSMRWRLEDVA